MRFGSRLLRSTCLVVGFVSMVTAAIAIFAPKLLAAVIVLLVVLAALSAPRAMRRLGERSRRSMHYRP
ncbi:MAG: hypothetical protein ACRDK2_13060 [Solirubrobacteraceae bacterium]